MNSSETITLVNTYFGAWPRWFPIFLASCERNESVRFLFFTDCPIPDRAPKNVEFIPFDKAQFNRLASLKLGMPIEISHPLKFCDFRPAFGKIFEDFLGDSAFWGFCDVDLVFGDIRRFVTSEALAGHDLISARKEYTAGHFTIFRNSDAMRRLYAESADHEYVFQTPNEHFFFEECNGVWYQLMSGMSILDPRVKSAKRPCAPCESLTHVVRRLEQDGKIRASFNAWALESDKLGADLTVVDWTGRLRWDQGTLTSLSDGREHMYMHFHHLKGRASFLIPSWSAVPSLFYLTENGFTTELPKPPSSSDGFNAQPSPAAGAAASGVGTRPGRRETRTPEERARLMAALSPEKKALLEQKLRDRGIERQRVGEQPLLDRIDRDQPLALSRVQERLWFLNKFSPESAEYNLPCAYRLAGRLDVAAFGKALFAVVDRHEALRTSYALRRSGPVQIIHPPSDEHLRIVDVSSLANPEAEAARLANVEAREPFDLENGRPFRVLLVKVTELDHLLCVVAHHSVWDGWSLNVFWRELGVLYEAFLRHAPPPLPPVPLQFADFAAWERRWLTGERLESELTYWATQLKDAPDTLLHTDRPRPKLLRAAGRRHEIRFSRELTRALQALSQREQVSLTTTLLTAYAALLSRYGRVETVVIGAPVTLRGSVELESIIGMLSDAVPLRIDLTQDPSVRDSIRRVAAALQASLLHRHVPLAELVRRLGKAGSARLNLFRYMFSVEDFVLTAPKLVGLVLRNSPLEFDAVDAELVTKFWLDDGVLHATIGYSTVLFDAETIAGMAVALTALLEGIAANPEAVIGRLPIEMRSESVAG